MLYTNLDNIIPNFALGVSFIAALFFTYYHYYMNNYTVKIYSNYLWLVVLYIFSKSYIIHLNFEKSVFFHILVESFFWISLLLYVKFLYTAIHFKDQSKFLANTKKIAYLLVVIDFLLYITTTYFYSEKEYYFKNYALLLSFSFIFIILFLITKFYYKRILTDYKLLYLGTFIFYIFNTILISTKQNEILTISKFSFLCLGMTIEISIFVISLCIKLKNENEQKIKIIEENSEKTKKILLQEINRQDIIRQSKYAERLKISVDIHDGISNAVAGLRYYLESKWIKSKSEEEKELLREIGQEANTIYKQIREYINKLHSNKEDEKYDIAQFLFSLQEKYEDSIKFEIIIDEEKIDNMYDFQQREFYYLLSEGIGNAIKHSKSNFISIRIHFGKEYCYFSIVDQGIGFLYDEKKNTSIGISSINTRIKNLNGEISIISELEKGTQIKGKFIVEFNTNSFNPL